MPLPIDIDKAAPADADNPSAGAASIRDLKDFLESVLGLTDATNYTGAAFSITTAGVVSVVQTPFAPSVSDAVALGSTTKMWSDLFLANGAVVNFNNGNYTVTHSAGLLTASGALTVSGSVITSATFFPTKINSPNATALPFNNNADNAELMRLTNGGILALGTTFVTGAAAGDFIIPNAKTIWGVNAAGNALRALISLTSGDDVHIGQGGVGAVELVLSSNLIGSAKTVSATANDSAGAGYRYLIVPNA